MKKKLKLIGYAACCILIALCSYYLRDRKSASEVRYARTETLLSIQERLRFSGVPDSARAKLIADDLRMRRKMMVHWTESLHYLGRLFPEWPLMRELIKRADNATVISIYQADTMGFAGVRSNTLTIIPLAPDEYLLCQPGNTNKKPYHTDFSQMIVLQSDNFEKGDKHSLDNVRNFVHELCHVYLYHVGYKGAHRRDGDPRGQHPWIDSIDRKIVNEIPHYLSTDYYAHAFNSGKYYPRFQELSKEAFALRVNGKFSSDSAAFYRKADSIDELRDQFIEKHFSKR